MNKWRLYQIMHEKGVSTDELCDHLKIARSTFSKKCNGRSEFTLKEINQILAYLNLSSPMGIFFDEKVS